AGTAEVQPVEAPDPVAGMAQHGPPQVELVEAGLSVERMGAGQAEVTLEVQRRQHLAVGNELSDPGRDALERPDHGVAKGIGTSGSPGAVPERVWRVLGDDAHDVGAGLGPLDE